MAEEGRLQFYPWDVPMPRERPWEAPGEAELKVQRMDADLARMQEEQKQIDQNRVAQEYKLSAKNQEIKHLLGEPPPANVAGTPFDLYWRPPKEQPYGKFGPGGDLDAMRMFQIMTGMFSPMTGLDWLARKTTGDLLYPQERRTKLYQGPPGRHQPMIGE